jgi:hypothetical protein
MPCRSIERPQRISEFKTLAVTAEWEGFMEKSVWVKIVWAGAILAIPAAVLLVQKPEAPRATVETRRVFAPEQPVAVDIVDQQIEAVRPAESAAPEPPKPKALRIGADKITSKGTPGDPALAKVETGGQNLASVLAPVAGPHAGP